MSVGYKIQKKAFLSECIFLKKSFVTYIEKKIKKNLRKMRKVEKRKKSLETEKVKAFSSYSYKYG